MADPPPEGVWCCLLLRNCPLEQLAGLAIDEGEAKIGGALTQTANDALAVLGAMPRSSSWRRPTTPYRNA